MIYMRKNGFFQVLGLMFLLSACGQAEPESNGVLTVIQNKAVVLHDSIQQKEVCKNQYCEPNYTLYANFGRKRSPPHSDPVPIPIVNPPNADVPPVSSIGTSGDLYDYAKNIMNTAEAWSVTEGDPEIIVADIDSGMDLSHPDLVANLWTNPKESAADPGVDHDGNGYVNDLHGYDFYANKPDPIDENGHGTHTAGTIAAVRNNQGVIGVAPRVKVMPLRFLGPDGQGGTDGAIQAIYYAIHMGARVISASWGGGGFSSLLAQAVKDAEDAGVVFVAAAGNDGRDISRFPTYPASFPNVLTVGATTAADQLAGFSNFGVNSVLIAAPGDRIYSTYLHQSYATMSGTSMATPQVSGAVALALSKNKSLMPKQIRSAICGTADPISTYGTQCGRINVGRFLKSI